MDLFGNIPFYVLADRRLSDFDKLLFGYINGMCKAKGYFDETNKQVGDFFGKHPVTVSSARQSLIKLGYVLCRGSVLTISENAKCISENTNEVSENTKAESKGVSENAKATLAKTLSPLSENANPISENAKHLREKNIELNKSVQESEPKAPEPTPQQIDIAELNTENAKAQLIESLKANNNALLTQILQSARVKATLKHKAWQWVLFELDKCINYYIGKDEQTRIGQKRALKATLQNWLIRAGQAGYDSFEYKPETQPQPIEPKKDIIVKTRPYAKVNRP